MTRIMTITSGLPGTGVTHLAINIALEQVRRGRQSGVYCAREAATPVEQLLQVQQPVSMLRRVDDVRDRGLLRSGYQGIDILSCGTPLREWPSIPAEQRSRCLSEMDVPEGYDDFIFDTSGMDPRTQLACCRAAAIIVVVVTPASQTRAEAFALLRVLQLNGLSGQLRLLVNKARYPADNEDNHEAFPEDFSRRVKASLGLDIPLLGSLPEDEAVSRAQQQRQAFSALFPESPAAASVVSLCNTLDDIELQFFSGPRTLPALWRALVDTIQLPVSLPGGAHLDDGEGDSVHEAVAADSHVAVTGDHRDTGLLNFQGTLASLASVRERLQGDYQSFLADLDILLEGHERDRVLTEVNNGHLHREQILALLSRLLGLLEAASPVQSLRFRVVDTTISRDDAAWLVPGRYLKYAFDMRESMLPDAARVMLQTVQALSESMGTDDEAIYELVSEQRDSSLSIIDDPHDGVRIQAWLNLGTSEQLAVLSVRERRVPAG